MGGWAAARRRKATGPKAYVPPTQLIEQRTVWHEDGPELFIPMRVAAQDNRLHYMASAAKDKREQTNLLLLLRTHLRDMDRKHVEHITYTRIGIGRLAAHDNLPWAFKHVVDMVSYWLVDGSDPVPWSRIGRYDDQLITLGEVTWDYEQKTNSPLRKPQGIAIRFRLRSPQAAPT